MRKYFTGNAISSCRTTPAAGTAGRAPSCHVLVLGGYKGELLTIVDLLQRDLRILRKTLLRCIGEHKGFWLLWGRHCRRVVLGIHRVRLMSQSS